MSDGDMEDEVGSDKIDSCHEVTDLYVHGFFKEYRFLSNFYPASFTDKDGMVWTSSEAYYQAHKLPDPYREDVRLAKIEKCKRVAYKHIKAGHALENFDKDDIMAKALVYKFKQNDDLASLLMETYPRELVETNWWNDKYWGVCDGLGENRLGVMLMEVRKILMEGGK
jgi:ribA/ribD-fused uncharacterized protein